MSQTSHAVVAQTFVGDFGQVVSRLRISCPDGDPGLAPADFDIVNGFVNSSETLPCQGVREVHWENGELVLTVDPFLYRTDFSVRGTGRAEAFSFVKSDVRAVELQDEELFESCEENGTLYRLYSPVGDEPRPLILFLHGGGECGSDNTLQLTGTLGAIKLAKRFPDMYVMAPQAPDGGMTVYEMRSRIQGGGGLVSIDIGADTESGKGARGWNREYLIGVSSCIRRMIREGKVDERRVYVIGLSMGGAGVLKELSVAPQLFASAVCICPGMNGETYEILEHLPQVPTYLATSYIDHQPVRHAYILRACQALWERGRTDVRLTVFTKDELRRYRIATAPGLDKGQIQSENHNSWVLVFHNEYGILDWMVSHVKK